LERNQGVQNNNFFSADFMKRYLVLQGSSFAVSGLVCSKLQNITNVHLNQGQVQAESLLQVSFSTKLGNNIESSIFIKVPRTANNE